MSGRGTARVALRLALGAAFLSAVASRLGLWGSHAGHPAAAFTAFIEYVGELNPWAPAGGWPALAVLVTALEVSLGLGLCLGVAPRVVGLMAGGLLTVFAVTMTVFTGPKSALDYSVWTAAASAFLLGLDTSPVAARSPADAPPGRAAADAAQPMA